MSAYVQKKAKKERETIKGEQHSKGQKEKANTNNNKNKKKDASLATALLLTWVSREALLATSWRATDGGLLFSGPSRCGKPTPGNRVWPAYTRAL